MFESAEAQIVAERSARKEPLSDAEAQALLAEVDTVRIARGKKIVEAEADEVSVDDLKGPSGKIRAPTVRVGSTLLVGFHRDGLRELVDG